MNRGREVVAGAVGGVVGALAMTTVRLAAERMGVLTEPLPHKIERRVTMQVGVAEHLSARQANWVAGGGHLGLGATYGAGYGWFHQATHLPATVDGPLYGFLVYALNLVGIGPMFQLIRSPWHEAPALAGRRLLVHLLYGLVTGMVAEQINERVFDSKPLPLPLRNQLGIQPGIAPRREAAPRTQPQGDALQWAMRMITAPGVHGQLQRNGDYLIGYTVAQRADGNGGGTDGPAEKVYLEIIVANAADQHTIADLSVQAKLVDQRGDEVSTHQQPLCLRPQPRHYGRTWRIPGAGEYTLYVRVEPPHHPAQMPATDNGWRQVEPMEVAFPGIKIEIDQEL